MNKQELINAFNAKYRKNMEPLTEDDTALPYIEVSTSDNKVFIHNYGGVSYVSLRASN